MTSILSFKCTDCSAYAGMQRSIRCQVPTKTSLKGYQALYTWAFTDSLGRGQEETPTRELTTDYTTLETWGLLRLLHRNIPDLLSFAEALSTWSSSETLQGKALGIQKAIDTCISVWNDLSIQWNLRTTPTFQVKIEVFNIKVQRGVVRSSALASKMIVLKDITTEACPLSRESLSVACHSSPALNDFPALSNRLLASKGQRRKT